MKTLASLSLLIPLLATTVSAGEPSSRRYHPATSTVAPEGIRPAVSAEPILPPLEEGVASLKFSEIFQLPIGEGGAEFTDKARALDGKKVRILGFMVKEDTSPDNCNPGAPRNRPAWMSSVIPGRLMLTPSATEVSMSHYALCDDLPAHTVFVTVPDRFGEQVPYAKGLLLLTGTLSIGNKNEPDGRISSVRLLLDPSPAAPPAEKITPVTLSSSKSDSVKTQ